MACDKCVLTERRSLLYGFATPMHLVIPNCSGKADRDYAQDRALDYTVLNFCEKAKTITFVLLQEGTSVRACTVVV
jgi:hypothetical protein